METNYDANIFGREFGSVPSFFAFPLSFMPRRFCVVGIWSDGCCTDFRFGRAK